MEIVKMGTSEGRGSFLPVTKTEGRMIFLGFGQSGLWVAADDVTRLTFQPRALVKLIEKPGMVVVAGKGLGPFQVLEWVQPFKVRLQFPLNATVEVSPDHLEAFIEAVAEATAPSQPAA